MVINGWRILFFELFKVEFESLVITVQRLKEKDPDSYKKKQQTKLLKAIYKVITEVVPADPMQKQFMISKTLRDHKQFRRAKQGLPNRYRLFFRFSTEDKSIVYIWFNDEFTLRNQAGRHDVYEVFKDMLKAGDVPTDYKTLQDQSSSPKL